MASNVIDREIGDRVAHALWRAKVSQRQLAEALGVDQGSVSRRLRGNTAWKVSEVYAAAELLGVDRDALLPTWDELVGGAAQSAPTSDGTTEPNRWTPRGWNRTVHRRPPRPLIARHAR